MEEVVENVLLQDGIRRLRVISDVCISPLRWVAALPDEAVRVAELVPAEDASLGIHSLIVTWPARELFLGVQFPSLGKIEKPMVLWKLVEGERISMVVRLAAEVFERGVGRKPSVAWIRSMPKGMEEFEIAGGYVAEAVTVPIEDGIAGVSLRTAEWVWAGCVVVG